MAVATATSTTMDADHAANGAAHEPAIKVEAEAPPASSNNADRPSEAAPLAPPRPAPGRASDPPDYFNQTHTNFSLEPNVFEQSFSNPTAETPGRNPILPSVANITSPSPLPGITPGWQSLRAGPLSPAMLSAPTGQNDYFTESFRGFPTPNESSLRTGLTPGPGSLFPGQSPNPQAMFSLQSGPSTADFQQSAVRAAAHAQGKGPSATSMPATQSDAASTFEAPAAFTQTAQAQPIGQHDPNINNAANDLLSFSQSQQSSRNGTVPNSSMSMAATIVPAPSAAAVASATHMARSAPAPDPQRRDTRGSIVSDVTVATAVSGGLLSDSDGKGATRSRPKPARKASQPAPKASRPKKAKTTAGNAMSTSPEVSDAEEQQLFKQQSQTGEKTKFTEEEKRKHFLEKNRLAALKCRQRKKLWVNDLQTRVDMYAQENSQLQSSISGLREEIINLKTVLAQHRECSVANMQGLGGAAMLNFLGLDLGGAGAGAVPAPAAALGPASTAPGPPGPINGNGVPASATADPTWQ